MSNRLCTYGFILQLKDNNKLIDQKIIKADDLSQLIP